VRVHGIRVLRELDGSWTVVLDGDAQRVEAEPADHLGHADPAGHPALLAVDPDP
jgi:hypothetical protein